MHSVSKNLQRDQEPGERDPKQRPLQGAFLVPPVLPVVLIFSELGMVFPELPMTLNFQQFGDVSLMAA